MALVLEVKADEDNVRDNVKDNVRDNTVFLEQGRLTPFAGYLVSPSKMEKNIYIMTDCLYFKDIMEIQEQECCVVKGEKGVIEKELEIKEKECIAIEKGLKEEIVTLSRFYKKPWFVSASTAIIILLIVGL